jgi:hypothetical protein
MNPLIPGIPMRPREPMVNAANVHGMRWPSPASSLTFSRLVVA